MRRLFRITHWVARARYWKRQAQTAKAEVARLQLSLLAETWRNRAREDTFASAAILGQRNMWGIAPRTGPAATEQPKPRPQPIDPYQLSGPDLMEFDTFWKPDAEAAGISILQAKQKFINEVVLPRRMPLNDDPYGAN